MCEIRYQKVDNTHHDSELSKRKFKVGQFISRHDDGHQWTYNELNNPRTGILILKGVPKEDVDEYFEPLLNFADLISLDPAIYKCPRREAKTRWHIDVTKLTTTIIDSLKDESSTAEQKRTALATIMIDDA